MPARLRKDKYNEVLKIAKKLTEFQDGKESRELILNFSRINFISWRQTLNQV